MPAGRLSRPIGGSGCEDGLDLGGDLERILVEDEMAGVEPDQLGIRQVVEIGARARREEEGVVLAPDDRGLRLVGGEGGLPLGIEADIGLVVLSRSTW